MISALVVVAVLMAAALVALLAIKTVQIIPPAGRRTWNGSADTAGPWSQA